jgi:hypothetical protein
MSKKLSVGKLLPVLLILASVGLNVFLYVKWQNIKNNDPIVVRKRIVDKMAQITELPKDEEPSVATVSDEEKLKTQT